MRAAKAQEALRVRHSRDPVRHEPKREAGEIESAGGARGRVMVRWEMAVATRVAAGGGNVGRIQDICVDEFELEWCQPRKRVHASSDVAATNLLVDFNVEIVVSLLHMLFPENLPLEKL